MDRRDVARREPPEPTPAPLARHGAGGHACAERRRRVPIKGPAARLAANMEESLAVPTATTFRQLPVTALETARAASTRRSPPRDATPKLSFTHLIAYALVLRVEEAPRHGAQLSRHRRHRVPLHPFASTSASPSTSSARTAPADSWCPSSRVPTPLISPAFLRRLRRTGREGARQQAHARRFRGRLHDAHQPRRARHFDASVPRLMAGQGSIIATGADRVSARVHRREQERLRARHREDHDGDEHVRSPGHPGGRVGEFLRDGGSPAAGRRWVLREIVASFGLGSRWPTVAPQPSQVTWHRPRCRRPALRPWRTARCSTLRPAMFLVENVPHARPPRGAPRPARLSPRGDPALDPCRSGSRPKPWPRFRPTSCASPCQADARRCLPDLQATYCGTLAYEIEHVRVTSSAPGFARPSSPARIRSQLDARRQKAPAQAAHRGRGAGAVPAQGVSRPEALLDRGRGPDGPDARYHHRDGRRGRARATSSSAWRTAAGST